MFRLCELGCGAGNTVFPFLQEMEALKTHDFMVYACDYSTKAIQVVKSNDLYNEAKCKAIVYGKNQLIYKFSIVY